MRAHTMPIIPTLLACFALFGPARADSGCHAAADAGDIAAAACETVLTFTATVSGAPVEVTVVADHVLGIGPARSGEIRTAVDRSAARQTDLALTGFPDVTIALAERLHEEPEGTDGATGMSGSDCAIALSGPDVLGDAGRLRHAIAHELFHCAQYSMQRSLTGRTSSAWWVEGSAEWFANWTFPGTANSSAFVAEFDSLSAGTPVTAMDYAAVVFFAWYGQARGPDAIVGLIRGATGSPDDLADAVGEDGWWAFVDAYFDRTIQWPDGTPLPSAPQRGPTYTFASSEEVLFEADRYVLYRADLVFEAGYWVLENRLDAGRYDIGEGRRQLPDAIETSCEEPTRFTLRGSSAQPDGFRLTVDATLEEEAACAGCVEAPAFDRCLIGTWQFSAGGPVEWMRRQMGPDVQIAIASDGDPSMTFRGNGTYRAFMTGLSGTVTTEDGRGAFEESTVAAGRWSTSGSALHICEDALSAGGSITVEVPGISQTTPFASYVGAGTAMQLDYACSGDLLITELRFPGIADPIVTNYTRVAPSRR